jgi:hypothetical protein
MAKIERGPRYYARSASDSSDDWPFWFVADRENGDLNVTNRLLRADAPETLAQFQPKPQAIFLADLANSGRSLDWLYLNRLRAAMSRVHARGGSCRAWKIGDGYVLAWIE